MSETSILEGALERMMATGTPIAVARSVSTEGWMLFSPLRSILGFVSELPELPSAGDSYILTAGPDQTSIVFLAADGVWHYSTPVAGDQVFDQDTQAYYEFTGTFWDAPPAPEPVLTPIIYKSADYTVINADVVTGHLILKVDASAGVVQITIDPALGIISSTAQITLQKTDATFNPVNISDGSTIIDVIATPATTTGQIGGWRIIDMNGTILGCIGVG